jgi:hypothetical protein
MLFYYGWMCSSWVLNHLGIAAAFRPVHWFRKVKPGSLQYDFLQILRSILCRDEDTILTISLACLFMTSSVILVGSMRFFQAHCSRILWSLMSLGTVVCHSVESTSFERRTRTRVRLVRYDIHSVVEKDWLLGFVLSSYVAHTAHLTV